ncbi:MAG: hypothetical protein JWO22_2982 [Frankiales bacterium]|nr:hypothetical protein [Frankiales bacterium]
MRFTAELMLHGKTATGFVVPDSVVDELGSGKKPAVSVTINGHTYRSSIAFMGGRFLLGVSADNRAAADVSAGDVVDVEVVLDTAPRVIEVPADLAKAMTKPARAFWDTLSYSHQRAYAEAVTGAKKEETRAKRVADTVAKLEAGTPR